MTTRHTGRIAALLSALVLGGLCGCTTVKFVLKNPYTAEVWTVYEHTIGSDTIVYCPPVENATCSTAVMVGNRGSLAAASAASSPDDE